jgi:hypothetical protein
MDAAGRVAHCFVMQSHRGKSTTERPLLSVADYDESVRKSVRESLPDLLGEFGIAARAFSSAAPVFVFEGVKPEFRDR